MKEDQKKNDQQQTGENRKVKISRQEASKVLKGVKDQMAKYMMKPSPDEMQKYKQKDEDKDW